MKNKLFLLTIAGFVFCGILTFIYSRTEAQTSRPSVKQNDQALQIVKSQAVSNAFFESLQTDQAFNSNELKLTRAYFSEQSQGENTIRTGEFDKWHMLEFENNKGKIQISIYEYDSPERASKILNTFWNSQGSVAATKEFGNEGFRGFDDNGKLVGMRFRKDQFAVFISTDSEELLKSFAANALKAIQAK